MAAVAAVALLLLLALGGCGSALSLEHFVARANAICADTTLRERALGAAPRFTRATPANLAAATTYLTRLVPILSDASSQLRAIGAPDQRASTVDALLMKIDDATGALRTSSAAAANGDLAGFRVAFPAAVRADEDASALDEQLGLTLCAQLATQAFRTTTDGAPPATPTPFAAASPSA